MPTLNHIANEALGSGFQFPLRINEQGGLAVAQDEEKVKASIEMILSTAKGERVMRPEFGCDLHRFVFGTLNSTNLTLLKSAVRDALVRWEPRIEVNTVDVKPDAHRDGLLGINVTYTIRITNSVANLVYPFYLQTGD